MVFSKIPERFVYLASYPRSGNTWMINSLNMLYSGIRSEARSSHELYPFIYYYTNYFYIKTETEVDASRLLIIKTHDTHDVYRRFYPPQKCLYIYRDGRDVLLSYYLYTKMCSDPTKIKYGRVGTRQDPTALTTADVNYDATEFTAFIKAHALEWANHLTGWLEDSSIFSLKYEDLHSRFSNTLTDIVEYIGIENTVTVSEVEKEYVGKFRGHLLNDNRSFFRRGIIGDWQNYYTKEQENIFLNLAGTTLRKLGYT